MNRLTFYDKDSNPIIEPMDGAKRRGYLQEIKADYRYFESSYKRADFQINIEDIKVQDTSEMIIEELRKHSVILPSQAFLE